MSDLQEQIKISTTEGYVPHQHSCTQIKFVEELCDKYVHLQNISDVLPFHISKDVNKPLKLPVSWADPQEVHLREVGMCLH